jgi:hypothetical protein
LFLAALAFGAVHPRFFQQEGEAMKLLALFGLLAATLLLTGCATPGYSVNERFQRIGRNWDYEGKQIADDVDEALLLRPAGTLTWWNVQ